jgi:cytochrome c oxidase assembly protein subunit 15
MKALRYWLWLGVFMVLVQVVIGGITRLTGSGLSITEWDVIMGALPPMNDTQWEEAFTLYKQFPQYEKVNSDMDLAGFKGIFWWEYIHRNWARLIGIVFLIPFLIFLAQKRIPRKLMPGLVVVFLLGGLQGFFGWIMVASGLIDKPWVSPYNLTLHLVMALFLFAYLIWLALSVRRKPLQADHPVAHRSVKWLIGLITLQIVFGGFMAGSKAGLLYNTWPLMNGTFVPEMAFSGKGFLAAVLENTTTINFIHRTLGIVVVLAVAIFWMRNRGYSTDTMRNLEHALLLTVVIQFLLGVGTLLMATGSIPVFMGVVHQGVAFILTGIAVAILFYGKRREGIGS